MARGDCERAFARAAHDDGIELVRQSFTWLNQRGHLGLPAGAARAVGPLERIFLALDGDSDALAAAPPTRLPGDFFHPPSRTLIEIDESQHFSSARLAALELYPLDVGLGYDIASYRRLCESWRGTADSYFRSKAARAFGTEGRQRQRAYYDALRDLATPAMGHPPLIRIAAPRRDGTTAYGEHRERLLALNEGAAE